jgi:hypothetical protein
MSVQTSYEQNISNALPGQIADVHPHETVSRAAEGAVAFGYGVERGTDADKQCEVGASTAAKFLGIAVRDLGREGVIFTGDLTGYADEETVAVMREGYIYCTIPTGGSPGDPINVHDTTGVIDAGAPASGEHALTGATLEATTAAGAVGLVRLDGLTLGAAG